MKLLIILLINLFIIFQQVFSANILILYCHDTISHAGSMMPYFNKFNLKY